MQRRTITRKNTTRTLPHEHRIDAALAEDDPLKPILPATLPTTRHPMQLPHRRPKRRHPQSVTGSTDTEPMLTDRQQQILDFEEAWSGVPGNREAAIRDTFHVSPARYFQELYRVLDTPAALEVDPMLVKRLRRMRERRREARVTPFHG